MAMRVFKTDTDFALFNKSYLPDLSWSLRLYASFEKFSQARVPFYIVVPQSDLSDFTAAFQLFRRAGYIRQTPEIFPEEELFEAVDIEIPQHFDGWRTQQVVKLAIGLSGLAKQYITVDSAVLFSKAFSPKDMAFTGSGLLKTAARPLSRADRRSVAARINDRLWLRGELVSFSEGFDAISAFIGDVADETHHYVSATCIISSFAIRELDAFAREKGLSGLVGLIDYAPYECAWYGDFVYIKRPIPFHPIEPNIMRPCVSMEHLRCFESSDWLLHDDYVGVLFNPPASNHLDPQRALEVVCANDTYKTRLQSYFEKRIDHLFYPDIMKLRVTSPQVGMASGVTLIDDEACISGITGHALYVHSLWLGAGMWQLMVVGSSEKSEGAITFEITHAAPNGLQMDLWHCEPPVSTLLTQRTFLVGANLPVHIIVNCTGAASVRVREFVLMRLGPAESGPGVKPVDEKSCRI